MSWREALPAVRGRLLPGEPLGPFTWFRVGGAADVLFLPADHEDLGAFLQALPENVPVTVLGVGSNVIVRDGGVEGVVVRLAGRPFGAITVEGEFITAGAGALDAAWPRPRPRRGWRGWNSTPASPARSAAP